MNFKFNLKKYLVLGLVGLGLVIGDSNADKNSNDSMSYIDNAKFNKLIDLEKLSSELDEVSNAFNNVMRNDMDVWQNIFHGYIPSINKQQFSSFLNTFKSKFFKGFVNNKSFELRNEYIEICKTLLSFAKIVATIQNYNSEHQNQISLYSVANCTVGKILVGLENTSEIDDFINKYKDQYKLHSDCGVLGVLEYLFNNSSSSVSDDQYVTFLKSIIKKDDIVTKTINSKVDCGCYSFFPFSDYKNSESINTLLEGNSVNVNKVLSLLKNIGYSNKMTASEAWLLSLNPKLDAVTELTNEKLVEASKLGSPAELYNWISKQSTTGKTPVVSPNDDDNGKKNPDRGKDDEQGGNNPEDKGGDGFAYVAGLSGKLGGKELKITSTENEPVVSGHSKTFKLDKNLTVDKVIDELSKGNNVVIDMRGVLRRGLYPIMLNDIGTPYRAGENGWSNTKNNFCNITLAS